MSREELMEPRYKIVADWPNSIYKVGKTFIRDGGYLFYEGVNHASFLKPDNYPHLFKKLEWWNERQKKDLPEYVLYADKTSLHYGIHKVISWNEINRGYVVLNIGSSPIIGYTPATEEEYNAFLTTTR